MRGVRVFIDSTTFLYTIDQLERQKGALAQIWLNRLSVEGCGCTNLQVLNEIANVATRKSHRFADVFFNIDAFATFGVEPIEWKTTIVARAIHRAHRFSWWDCLLLTSAINLGCTHFLSEDLQDGQRVEGLTILSPFAHTPDEILISR